MGHSGQNYSVIRRRRRLFRVSRVSLLVEVDVAKNYLFISPCAGTADRESVRLDAVSHYYYRGFHELGPPDAISLRGRVRRRDGPKPAWQRLYGSPAVT